MANNGGRTGRRYGNDGLSDQQLALINEQQPPRLPVPQGGLARQLGITQPLWKLLTDTVYPSAKTVDGIMQAVAYCHERKLDVMKRPVHVVPMYNSALGREIETVWPGIGEVRTTAARTGQWAGTDDVVFGPTQNKGFRDKQTRNKRGGESYVKEESCDAFEWPLWAQFTVYKIVGGHRVAFVGPKVLFMETFAGVSGLSVPNAMWRKRPFGQLEKCAEAAALRRAFPEELGEQYVAEEMEGKTLVGHNGGPAMDDAEQTVVHDVKPTRESSAAADRKRASDERFVENCRAGIPKSDAASLDRAASVDADRIAALDEDLRLEVEAMYADRRKQLGVDTPSTPDDIAGYKADFRRKLKATQTFDEVDALIDAESANLDALPPADDAELGEDVTSHREDIAAIHSPAGDTAPPTDDGNQSGDEEETT